MKNTFYKFPSTPHLQTSKGTDIRTDKTLSYCEFSDFFQHELIIEEKIDGANLGISFGSDGNILVQNRGAYLNFPRFGQWKKLDSWLAPRIDTLFEYLYDRFILFGEWCYAQHSIFYNKLPDWFLGFDIFDKHTELFLSTRLRDSLFNKMHIIPVPRLAQGHFTFNEIKKLLSSSKFSDQAAEGIYLRVEKDNYLQQRAKLVRPAFIQTMDGHWSRTALKPNQLQAVV